MAPSKARKTTTGPVRRSTRVKEKEAKLAEQEAQAKPTPKSETIPTRSPSSSDEETPSCSLAFAPIDTSTSTVNTNVSSEMSVVSKQEATNLLSDFDPAKHARRQIVIPQRIQIDNGFSDDDSNSDDDMVDVQKVEDAAQHVSVVVQTPQQKRESERLKLEIRHMLNHVAADRNDMLHKVHLVMLTSWMRYTIRSLKSFVKKQKHKSVFSNYLNGSEDDVLVALGKIDFQKEMSRKDSKRKKGSDPLISISKGSCGTYLEMAKFVFVNLFSLGYTVRLVHAIDPLEKGKRGIRVVIDGQGNAVNVDRVKQPPAAKTKGSTKKTAKRVEYYSDSEEFSDDDDIPKKKKKEAKKVPKKSVKDKLGPLTTELDENVNANDERRWIEASKKHQLYWCEVWDDKRDMWIYIDAYNEEKPHPVFKTPLLPESIAYVFAMDNDYGLRDVSIRYISNFALRSRRLRRFSEPFIFKMCHWPQTQANLYRSVAENDLFRALLMSQPIPTTQGGFKDHFLYILKGHELLTHTIHPDAQPCHHLGDRAVYYRHCLCLVDIPLRWEKRGRGMKPNVLPHCQKNGRRIPEKILKRKGLPKEYNDNPAAVDLFGVWQTDFIVPDPVTEEDDLPRNEFNNITIYKPWMIPEGTFMLRHPLFGKIADDAGILQVPAVTRWTFKKAKFIPVIFGNVFRKCDAGLLTDALIQFAHETLKAGVPFQMAAHTVLRASNKLIREDMVRFRSADAMLMASMRLKYQSKKTYY